MDIQTLKIDIIHWLTSMNDKDILEKIYALKDQQGEVELSTAQTTELEKRLKKYENGEMKFQTWDETRASIKKRSKNVI